VLVLTRRTGERIKVGPDIEIILVDAEKGRAKIGIVAPRSVSIHRTELGPLIVGAIEQRAAACSPEPCPDTDSEVD